MLDAPDIQLHGIRILSRVTFIWLIAIAWSMNEADQLARAKGLMTFRVEVMPMGLGTHSCLQPEPEELAPKPEPEKPPCPHSEHGKSVNPNN
jgi:hypothetical protein